VKFSLAKLRPREWRGRKKGGCKAQGRRRKVKWSKPARKKLPKTIPWEWNGTGRGGITQKKGKRAIMQTKATLGNRAMLQRNDQKKENEERLTLVMRGLQ